MDVNYKRFDYSAGLDDQRILFEECFPETSGTGVITKEHYKWKFHSPFINPASYEFEARLDKEMVGYYAAISYPYSFQGKKIMAGMVCDVMTGIKTRGKGVFTKLGIYSIEQMEQSGLAFITGFPIRSEVIPGHKKAGWTFPFEIPMYGKFLSLKAFSVAHNKNWMYYIGQPVLFLYNQILRIGNPATSKTKIEHYCSDDLDRIAGLDSFLNEWRKNIPVALYKNTEFLKWRLGAPAKSYFIAVVRDKDQIVGYSIARQVIKEKVPCLGILDFCILPGYLHLSSVLIRENEKFACENKDELILLMINRKWAQKYKLIRGGFFRTPYKFSFIIKKFDETLKNVIIMNENSWHLSWIDSDDL